MLKKTEVRGKKTEVRGEKTSESDGNQDFRGEIKIRLVQDR
jgi:hypothetical protein